MLKEKLSTRDLCLIGLFTALTVIMAQISIPTPMGVPLTLQTFAISLTGVLLGSRRGFISVLIYVLLGAAGVPVFAGFTGGFGIVFGDPTCGFIISFPVMAWIIGLGAEKSSKMSLVLGLVCGIAINYICGIIMFSAITNSGLAAAFLACVLPFIPIDVVKAITAGVLGIRLRARGMLSV